MDEYRPTPILKGKAAKQFYSLINDGPISKKQQKFLDDCKKLMMNMDKENKTKIDVGEGYWYRQTISILTKCIDNLVYAHENKHFTDDEMKMIDFKARELVEMIPSWGDVQNIKLR